MEWWIIIILLIIIVDILLQVHFFNKKQRAAQKKAEEHLYDALYFAVTGETRDDRTPAEIIADLSVDVFSLDKACKWLNHAMDDIYSEHCMKHTDYELEKMQEGAALYEAGVNYEEEKYEKKI